MKLKSENILDELKSEFPDFKIYKEAEGLPTVVFAFFVDYLSSAFKENDQTTIDKFSQFMSAMCASKDNTIEACIDEVVLGFYTDSERPYEALKKNMSGEIQERFDKTTEFWNRQKSI